MSERRVGLGFAMKTDICVSCSVMGFGEAEGMKTDISASPLRSIEFGVPSFRRSLPPPGSSSTEFACSTPPVRSLPPPASSSPSPAGVLHIMFCSGIGLADDESSDCHTSKIYLVLSHLLRMACAKNHIESLADIASELHKIGVLSTKSMIDVAAKPTLYNDPLFDQLKLKSKVHRFWEPVIDLGKNTSNSRYQNDFIPLQIIGKGGYGYVVCKNKLDGREYAIKKIRIRKQVLITDPCLSHQAPPSHNELGEVVALALLQHQNVVRYCQCWCEDGIEESFSKSGSAEIVF